MKFYLFYLKPNKELYAFTTQKDYAEKFLSQRNPKCFKVKEVTMEKPEAQAFMFTNRDLKLGDYPYQTDKGYNDYVMIMTTDKEESKINEKVEEMEHTVEQIERIFRKYKIKKKYRDAMYRLTTIYDDTGHIIIDVFSLFLDLFRNTFIEEKKVKNNGISVWSEQADKELLDNF